MAEINKIQVGTVTYDIRDASAYHGTPTDTNQKIKSVNGSTTVTFGANDEIALTAGTNVTLTGDATNKKITIAATDTNTWRPLGTTADTACAGNDSRLSNARTPTSHASTGTGYGVGTTSNYGHVKTQTGDMNGTTSTNGIAAGLGHTHGQYYLATNPNGYTTNTGTVTSVAVKMNGSVKGTVTTSGTIDLGTVLTAHQSLANYVTLDGTQTITGTKTISNSSGLGIFAGSGTPTYYKKDSISQSTSSGTLTYTFPSASGTLALTSQIPSVSNATITIKQGSTVKGSFTLNGSSATITLDASSGGDVYKSGGTSSAPQTFTGYNKFNQTIDAYAGIDTTNVFSRTDNEVYMGFGNQAIDFYVNSSRKMEIGPFGAYVFDPMYASGLWNVYNSDDDGIWFDDDGIKFMTNNATEMTFNSGNGLNLNGIPLTINTVSGDKIQIKSAGENDELYFVMGNNSSGVGNIDLGFNIPGTSGDLPCMRMWYNHYGSIGFDRYKNGGFSPVFEVGETIVCGQNDYESFGTITSSSQKKFSEVHSTIVTVYAQMSGTGSIKIHEGTSSSATSSSRVIAASSGYGSGQDCAVTFRARPNIYYYISFTNMKYYGASGTTASSAGVNYRYCYDV